MSLRSRTSSAPVDSALSNRLSAVLKVGVEHTSRARLCNVCPTSVAFVNLEALNSYDVKNSSGKPVELKTDADICAICQELLPGTREKSKFCNGKFVEEIDDSFDKSFDKRTVS